MSGDRRVPVVRTPKIAKTVLTAPLIRSSAEDGILAEKSSLLDKSGYIAIGGEIAIPALEVSNDTLEKFNVFTVRLCRSTLLPASHGS